MAVVICCLYIQSADNFRLHRQFKNQLGRGIKSSTLWEDECTLYQKLFDFAKEIKKYYKKNEKNSFCF